MQFQDRVKLITANLNDFLRLYKRPDHLDQNGALIEMREMAEEMNGLMPTSFGPEDLAGRVNEALRRVRQTYKGRGWPTVSHMVDAMNATARTAVAVVDGAAPKWRLDPLEIAARRINEGEAVGDEWLYGRNALLLTRTGRVTGQKLQEYRDSFADSLRELYETAEAENMLSRMMQRHADAEAMGA